MGYIKIPDGVTKTLDKTIKDFIWGTTQERRKIHLIGWDCHPSKGVGEPGFLKKWPPETKSF